MKTSNNQIATAQKVGNIINLVIAVTGAIICVYGLALAIVKSHAFGF